MRLLDLTEVASNLIYLPNILASANENLLSLVGILEVYFDVDWHNRPLFLFYFFTAARSFALRLRGL